MPNQEGLKRSYAERTKEAREKALQAVDSLKSEKTQVNFSTVAARSGISRHFLYGDQEVRSVIEAQRKGDVDSEINRRARYDKTSKSKDVIIAAKDKRIAKLEEENRKLKAELETLRGMVYARKDISSGTCTRCKKEQ